MRMPLVPPIIVIDGGDVGIFKTKEEAEMFLEPIDVENGEFIAYDSEGRLLDLYTVTEYQPCCLLLFIKIPIKHVKIQCKETEPKHKEDLYNALISFLENIEINSEDVRNFDLKELIDFLVKRFYS